MKPFTCELFTKLDRGNTFWGHKTSFLLEWLLLETWFEVPQPQQSLLSLLDGGKPTNIHGIALLGTTILGQLQISEFIYEHLETSKNIEHRRHGLPKETVSKKRGISTISMRKKSKEALHFGFPQAEDKVGWNHLGTTNLQTSQDIELSTKFLGFQCQFQTGDTI